MDGPAGRQSLRTNPSRLVERLRLGGDFGDFCLQCCVILFD
jgi:hypothetical protein